MVAAVAAVAVVVAAKMGPVFFFVENQRVVCRALGGDVLF
jgi:hypothetical protein